MGCDMTLGEVIRAVLATEALGSDKGQEFPTRMFGLAHHVLDTPAKRWGRRSVAAAGILEGFRRGDSQHVERELLRYWNRHLKPKPEWVDVDAPGAEVKACIAGCLVRIRMGGTGRQVALVDAGKQRYRVRLVTPCCSANPPYLMIERRIDGGDTECP